MDIGPACEADLNALEGLYRAAFPQEDLTPLIRALVPIVPAGFSLAAREGDALVGHVAFTPGRAAPVGEVALLGPLAVAPERQRGGVGSALVRAGFARLSDAGIGTVLVLGDPTYYGRFGFDREREIQPPYTLPRAWRTAWQSLTLPRDQANLDNRHHVILATPKTIQLPDPWMDASLWGP